MIASQTFNRRWPITAEQRTELVKQVHLIATGSTGDPREQLAAVRCLIAMESQNQTDQHKDDEQVLADRIVELAAGLGIDIELPGNLRG